MAREHRPGREYLELEKAVLRQSFLAHKLVLHGVPILEASLLAS
jgi:hypothetical protein